MRTVWHALRVAVLLGWAGSVSMAAGKPEDSSETLVFCGGTIVDGSGAAPRLADVWVAGGKIVAVGEAGELQADREIDITGQILAPGFIDTHAHGNPAKTPEFENFVRMGVTSICLGQDGGSAYTDDLEEWRTSVESAGVAVNIAPFVGHGSVRSRAVGISPDPSGEDLDEMRAMVEGAMKAGAFGLSTGLEYQPGSFAGMGELVAVAEPVAEHSGVVLSHVRNEDEREVLEAVGELLTQGRLSGAPVHVSHIKTVYGKGPEPAEKLLGLLAQARAEGVKVTADLYPYIASYTGIGIVFPDWAKPPYEYEDVVRERREELAEYLRTRVDRRNGPEATLIGTGKWSGKTLAVIAAETGQPFEDVLIDMGPRGTSGAYFVMDRESMEHFLVDPNVMICSDGSPTMLHPRAYGSFARILARYARDKKLLSLEEAVFKMSGLPSGTFGFDRGRPGGESGEEIVRRGRVEPGWAADLVVFDFDEVRDRATFEEPHALAEGFSHVMVNGTFVIEGGQSTGLLPGKVLRKL